MIDKLILELQALTDNKMLQILKKYLGKAFKRGYEKGYTAGELAGQKIGYVSDESCIGGIHDD